MNKLVVMYTVNRNNPKGTWSGTSYSLKEALKKKYEVIEIDLHQGTILRIIKSLSMRIGRYKKSIFFGPLYDWILEKKANFLLRNYKGIPVLEIANEVKINNDYYLYQDLAIAVLPKIQNEIKKSLNNSSGGLLMNLSDSEMKRKIEVQEKIYNNAKKVFFMGNWVVKEMNYLYPNLENKFTCVGGGINSEFLELEDLEFDKNEKIITFIGIDFERKAGDLVIKAFNLLNEKYNENADLYIAGPVEVKQLNNNIHFIGKVDRGELKEILKKSSVFCMPSRFEAYGLVFAEAMSLGNLCIGRNNYEMPYFIPSKQEGELISSDDPDELARLMHILLNDKERQLNAVKNSKEKQKIFSWESVAEKIYMDIK